MKKKALRQEGNISPLVINSNTEHNIVIPPEPPVPISTRDDATEALLPVDVYQPHTCCDRLCCGSIANMACGWPAGSVRALIAVIISLVSVCVFAFMVIYFTLQNNSNIALAGAGLLSTVLAAVIGYYFGTRTGSGPSTLLSSTTRST
jgi:hypothetical protein